MNGPYGIDYSDDGEWYEDLPTPEEITADSGQTVTDTSLESFSRLKAESRRLELLQEIIHPLTLKYGRAVTSNEICRATPTRQPVRNHNRSVGGDVSSLVSSGHLIRDADKTVVLDEKTGNTGRAYIVCPEDEIEPRMPKVQVSSELLRSTLMVLASIQTIRDPSGSMLHDAISQIMDKLDVGELCWSKMRKDALQRPTTLAYKI